MNKKIGHPEISVILDNLVFENQVVSECVPSQPGYKSVVLMEIFAIVRQDKIGEVGSLEFLKEVLYFNSHVGKIAVSEILDDDLFSSCVRQETIGALDGFRPSLPRSPQHDPVNLSSRVFLQQSEDRPSAPDLDVVGVGPERQDLLRPTSVLEDGEFLHAMPFIAPRPRWMARLAVSTPPTEPGRASKGPREAACP